VDVGSSRATIGTYCRRVDGCKRGCGIETFDYGRSGEGSKSWNALSDSGDGLMRPRHRHGGQGSEILITLPDSPHAVDELTFSG
jgi:hypothetical protein